MDILTMALPSDHLFYSAPSSPPADDFEFNLSGHLAAPTISAADELFHAGKILPLSSRLIQSKPRVADDVQTPRGRPKESRPGLRRKGISRSLSPLRVSEFALLQQQEQQQQTNTSSSSSFKVGKKWSFKDLLFRSASEGSSPIKHYPSLVIIDTANISSSSSSRGRSAHHIHYAPNGAVSDDLKKKKLASYKYSLLGCLGFHLITPSACPHFS